MTTIDYSKPPSLTYQQLLDTDTHEVPDVLRWFSPMAPSTDDVTVERYTSAEFHQLEVEQVWTKVWQMACREEDIPAVGDHITYDIVGRSILVVRSAADTIQAFHNVCPHRGRRLRESRGRDTELRCAFHGFAWQLDGCLKQVPCQWDFPRLEPDDWALSEVAVGTWGGFVFINMDPDCEPLEAHLGDLTRHFDRWPLEDRFKEAHVAKVMDCNWKVAQEAFMEAFHVVATHPQLLPSLGDAISQYDVFGNFSRALTPNGVPSPHITWQPSEQDMFDAMSDRNLDEEPRVIVPDGETARHVAAEAARESLRPALGDRADELCDAELSESIYYTVFPNFHPWGAYNRITYRFRPWGDWPNECLMECMYLDPYRGKRPPPCDIHMLGPDDSWTEAPELGFLARV
ncbi:MAG: aromatic ring-hydroxylating dioxygenase subunit alpha, partial [Acidimicrobiia bacterium]|nr:aromatic ring-hydroxylating dioxygenase subunit alpha [Acidimicrobiia bacterium]